MFSATISVESPVDSLSDVREILHRSSYKKMSRNLVFRANLLSESHLLLTCLKGCTPCFADFCSVSMKLCIKSLHAIQSIYEFRRDRIKQHRTFRTSINKIA